MVVLPAGVTAANISLAKVLEFLDGPFSEMAVGVANAEYVLWLGSAISKERVDDLGKVCRRVLNHLWDGRQAEGGAGPFANALERALDMAALSPGEKAMIDFATSPETWGVIDEIVGRLIRKYSDLLAIVVEGQDWRQQAKAVHNCE